MIPVELIPASVCEQIKYVFSDFDDTLTSEGKFHSTTLQMLEALQEAGIRTIIVTGRPAGWADFMARMLPVSSVVGENGALIYYLERYEMKRIYFSNSLVHSDTRFDQIRERLAEKVPEAKIAADQHFRMFDLAVDFAEEVVPPLGTSAITRIKECFDEVRAKSKISSIHVNGWFGQFDKYSACKYLIKYIFKEPCTDSAIYIGDSPNDEPLFEKFTYTAGVANIEKYKDSMIFSPKFVSKAFGHEGFNEIVSTILSYAKRHK